MGGGIIFQERGKNLPLNNRNTVVEAFDNLFGTIQTKETDKDVALLTERRIMLLRRF